MAEAMISGSGIVCDMMDTAYDDRSTDKVLPQELLSGTYELLSRAYNILCDLLSRTYDIIRVQYNFLAAVPRFRIIHAPVFI